MGFVMGTVSSAVSPPWSHITNGRSFPWSFLWSRNDKLCMRNTVMTGQTSR